MSNYNFTKLIEKKRNGHEFNKEDFDNLINFVVKSTDPSQNSSESADRAQIGAMLMAIYLKGLTGYETSLLTQSMTNSGYVFNWPPEWKHLVVDKHSTGGVGDKVSLVLVPVLAALGLKVPMISGRSLAHTGGTLDKLESIPGFNVHLTKEEIRNAVELTGCCIVGQTAECAPADNVFYQCREITATIDCPPLIIASIVSKKLCEGPSALIYDVKYGKGSVFKSIEEASDTALKLVRATVGVKVSAFLTSMENPLGQTIGDSLEVLEAIECLKGNGPADVLEVVYTLGKEILTLVFDMPEADGQKMILSVLNDGKALKKFHEMLIRQGVKERTAKAVCYGDASKILPKARDQTDIIYQGDEGFINQIDPLMLANLWKQKSFESDGDHGVGLKILKRIGEKILPGEAWLRVHCNIKLEDEAVAEIGKAISVSSIKTERIVTSSTYFTSKLAPEINQEKS